MKKLIIFSFFLFAAAASSIAQDFKADIATARSSYAGGKLEDAHFALLQALQEIDLIVGKEVLKLLPPKMDTLNMNAQDDHVMANAGFIGTTIHRSYGAVNKAQIEIINNSPIIGTLNAFLNTPILGGMMRDENNKMVKVQGYKGRLEKQGEDQSGKSNYNLQIPFNNALLTFTVNGTSENEIMTMVNTIPLQNIAKLIQ